MANLTNDAGDGGSGGVVSTSATAIVAAVMAKVGSKPNSIRTFTARFDVDGNAIFAFSSSHSRDEVIRIVKKARIGRSLSKATYPSMTHGMSTSATETPSTTSSTSSPGSLLNAGV